MEHPLKAKQTSRMIAAKLVASRVTQQSRRVSRKTRQSNTTLIIAITNSSTAIKMKGPAQNKLMMTQVSIAKL